MTILVTGANGQLGNEMRIIAKNSTDRYIFTDVVDASQVSVAMLHKLAVMMWILVPLSWISQTWRLCALQCVRMVSTQL